MPLDLQLPFFVYGTLRLGESNSQLWHDAIALNRPGILRAALMFDLGPYPMIIETEASEAESAPITGELIDVVSKRYTQILCTLDLLEGVDSLNPESDTTLYRRVARDIHLRDGNFVTAWVYFGRVEIARRGRFMPHGDWKRRFQETHTGEAAPQRQASSDC